MENIEKLKKMSELFKEIADIIDSVIVYSEKNKETLKEEERKDFESLIGRYTLKTIEISQLLK